MPMAPNQEPVAAAVHAMLDGRGEDARRALTDLLAREPANAVAHYLLGAELAQTAKWNEAEHHLTKAAVLDPTLWMARFQLGQLFLANGRFAECKAALQPVAQSSGALAAYGRALIAVADNDAAVAIASLEGGLNQHQEQPVLAQDMRELLGRLRDDPAAVEDVEAAIPGATMLLSNYTRYN